VQKELETYDNKHNILFDLKPTFFEKVNAILPATKELIK